MTGFKLTFFQMHELTQEQNSTVQEVVPWFLDNMPVSATELKLCMRLD
jgi:hypothetical protein